MRQGIWRYKRRVALGLALISLGLAATPAFQNLNALPDRIRLTRGAARPLTTSLPSQIWVRSDGSGLQLLRQAEGSRLLARQGPVAVRALRDGRYHLEMRLFRLIPIKRVTVDVVTPLALAPGGQSVGVMIDPGGVLVVDAAEVKGPDGRAAYPAREAGVRAGDVIVAINGERVRDQEMAALLIASGGRDGDPVQLRVRRGGAVVERAVQPLYDKEKQRFLIGLWIREGASGVGTLTFYDPSSGLFGALGHMVTDGSGRPYEVRQGALVQAFVSGLRPGRAGVPGEKIGIFLDQDRPLGVIERNSSFGVFGRLYEAPGQVQVQVLPVALHEEVREGPAQIATVLAGQAPERFNVVIERVFHQDVPNDRGMVIRITDPRLLSATGGIVQGMSGSPILQDGRLVGAVTHVFVKDPTRGFGVFAEWMAREMQGLPEAAEAADRVPGASRQRLAGKAS